MCWQVFGEMGLDTRRKSENGEEIGKNDRQKISDRKENFLYGMNIIKKEDSGTSRRIRGERK